MSDDELPLATVVARRYYLDNQSKVEIAAALELSRFKVARLLDLARDSGIVTITINDVGTVHRDLGAALRQRFGLRRAVVVGTVGGDDGHVRRQLGRAAAELLAEITGPGDVLGIGWARSVLEMAGHLNGITLRRVVQLTGALARPDVEINAPELVHAVARRAQARSSVIYAPMIASDAATAAAFARQPQIADTIRHFDEVTVAVMGVGGWTPPSSTLHDACTPAERELARRARVRADLSGVLLDELGHAVHAPLRERIIAITPGQLRRVPEVIAIAYGQEKVPAARAAIRGGYLNTLVTHTAFAEHLLNNRTAGEDPGPAG